MLVYSKEFLANIETINEWRAKDQTQAVIICTPVLNINGTVRYWGNDDKFRFQMRNTTVPFLEEKKINYISTHDNFIS